MLTAVRYGQGLSRLVLLAGSCLLGLVAVEASLALVGYSYSPLRIRVEAVNDWRPFHIFEDRHFVYDPELLWRPRSRFGVFNGQGYRGRELGAPGPAEPPRILAMGDSNTLGANSPDGPNWPAYLEELLSLRARGSTVVNAGVWGYSSFQGVRRLERALSLHPDLVLVSFGANDAHRVTRSDVEFAGRKSIVRALRMERAMLRWRIGQLLIAAWDRLGMPGRGRLIPRVDLPEYEGNLREMIRMARASDVSIVLLTRPFVGPSPDRIWWKNFAPVYNAATIGVARAAGVPVIDVYARFRDQPALFQDESHFNEAGHRAAAQLIAEEIAPILCAKRQICGWSTH